MKRRFLLGRKREGLVAIYDALLFLMVVILISVGMFLYTARSIEDSGAFSDDLYQSLTVNQVDMVEALSLNKSYPTPSVTWSNATNSTTELLNVSLSEPEAQTIEWLLESWSELTWRSESNNSEYDGTWDVSSLLPLVNTYFQNSRLNGTNHAWLFTYRGGQVLFGSNNITSTEDLPEDRWATNSDYSKTIFVDGTSVQLYNAELRYFMWME
jgi:hypothetical protein